MAMEPDTAFEGSAQPVVAFKFQTSPEQSSPGHILSSSPEHEDGRVGLKITQTWHAEQPATVREAFKFSHPLPFVKPVEVISASSSGGVYKDDSLGLCIEVPEGAVPGGSVLRLEVGICLYGPFNFPSDTTLIAPILMMCPQEDIPLKEPVLVTLPHIIDQASSDGVEGLGIKVVKADHKSLFYSQDADFEDIDASLTFQSERDEERVQFSLSNFCFVSLRAESKREVAVRFGYCISPMYPTVSSTSQFNCHLAITYYPRPWIEALKEQFLKEGFERMNTAARKFTINSEQGTVKGEITNKDELQRIWDAVDLQFGDRDGIQVLSVEAVDVWSRDMEELEDDIFNMQYPPCFCVLAIPKDPDSWKTVTLQEVMTLVGVSEEEVSQECTMEPDELMPIARQIDWLSYAYHLGLHKQDIQQIRTDLHANVQMKAVAVLQRWHKNIGHSATYKLLIEVCLKLDDVDAAEFICITAKS